MGGGTENKIFGGGMLELKFKTGLILGGGILKFGGGKLIFMNDISLSPFSYNNKIVFF